MSMQQTPKATFQGWLGPFYPDGLGQFARASWSHDRTVRDYVRVAEAVPGYASWSMPTSADGYGWYRLLEFRYGAAAILVAIPWAQDFSRAAGVGWDRSPAVYYNAAGEQHVPALLAALTLEMHKDQEAQSQSE